MKLKKSMILFLFCIATPSLQFGRTDMSFNGDATKEKPFAYAYIYSETAQFLKHDESVVFESHGPMIGIEHDLNSSEIIFNNDGAYLISFITVTNGRGSFALFLNNKLLKGSTYGTFADEDRSRSGQIIININKGDVLTLRSHSDIQPGFATIRTTNITKFGEIEPSVNASITILQIA